MVGYYRFDVIVLNGSSLLPSMLYVHPHPIWFVIVKMAAGESLKILCLTKISACCCPCDCTYKGVQDLFTKW